MERSDGKRSFIAVEADSIDSLERLRMIVRRDQIRAAAGSVLRRSSDSGRIEVFLNKQVAYAGHVSFSEAEGESPLGPIRLIIEAADPFEVVNWITGGLAERKPR